MRIGLITPLNGRPGSDNTPTWTSTRDRARRAEQVGFDSFVFEDALLYRSDEHTNGVWESMSMAAALAVATDTITIGQSVVNSPYRSPALVAKMADTIDEISGGRYVLGIGAGNTEDSDYEAFGFPTDRRYSRFVEAIEIIHGLLKTGSVDFEGDYYTVTNCELVLRGPRPEGPPINIAAGGPKMLRLAAKYGDAWNWWGWNESLSDIEARVRPLLVDLEHACEQEGRDPESLAKTFDLYTVVPPGFRTEDAAIDNPVHGSAEQIAEFLAGLAEMGFSEVRCDLAPVTLDAVEAMQSVVDIVHD